VCTYFSTRNPCCGKSAVPEHDLAAGDDHGDVGGCDMEAIQQLLDAGIAVQVEHGVGMPVASEELADWWGEPGR